MTSKPPSTTYHLPQSKPCRLWLRSTKHHRPPKRQNLLSCVHFLPKKQNHLFLLFMIYLSPLSPPFFLCYFWLVKYSYFQWIKDMIFMGKRPGIVVVQKLLKGMDRLPSNKQKLNENRSVHCGVFLSYATDNMGRNEQKQAWNIECSKKIINSGSNWNVLDLWSARYLSDSTLGVSPVLNSLRLILYYISRELSNKYALNSLRLSLVYYKTRELSNK